MGGVPFSLLAWIPWKVRIAHRFNRKSPKMAENHLKGRVGGGVSPFLHVFYLVPLYFFYGADRSPKMVFFNPNMGTGLKTPVWGLYWLSQKNCRGTRWEEGGHV